MLNLYLQVDGSTLMNAGIARSAEVLGLWRAWNDAGRSSETPSSGSPAGWWSSALEYSNLGMLPASAGSSFTQTISTSASSCLIWSDGAPKVNVLVVWDDTLSSDIMGAERTLLSGMSVCPVSAEVRGFWPQIGSLVSDRSARLSTRWELEFSTTKTTKVTFCWV